MRFCLSIFLLAGSATAYAADPTSPTRAPTPAAFHFENDILPILSRYGCNSSGCHGKAEGQGGFKLSVFASDPEADFAALTKEGRGRRVFPSKPEESLMLRKSTGRAPHGGGTKLGFGSEDYRIVRDWIAAGKQAELHIFAKGGHGFGMRKQGLPSDHWIERFADWLDMQGFLKK